MLNSYTSNYKYSTISSLEKYLTNQIILDHKNDLIEIANIDITKETEIDIEEFNKSNQLLFIRNLSLLIDIFTSNKCSIQSMTFFYKDLNYIVFLSKVSNMFPFIMLRIKESKKIQLKNTELVYDFPINDIFKKDIINRKRFDIILDNIGFLKYNVLGYEDNRIEVNNEIKISNGRTKSVINDTIGMNSLSESFQTYLMNMFVIMMKQEQHKEKIINFDNDALISKTYIIIDNDNMIIEIEKNQSKSLKYIAPTTNPLIKLDTFNKAKFLFESYKQTYKLPYQRLINIKTRMHYCIVYNGTDYYFLKVLAKYDAIKIAEKFGNIFDSTDIIIEGYKLQLVE